MDSSRLILLMIALCLALILLLFMAKPLKVAARFLLNALLGAVGLTAANFLLQPIGVYVGVNLLTAGFIGILGLPGFASLLFIQAIL